jgi:hypothetical protein
MQNGGLGGGNTEAVPTVTLRADNPLHMRLLTIASQGIDQELGSRAPVAIEVRRMMREFELFLEKHGRLPKAPRVMSGPVFPRF